LAGDEATIYDRKRLRVAYLLKGGSESQQFILDKERHNLRELNLFFLAARKTCYALAFHKGLAIVGHTAKDTGRVADERIGLPEL
jgi:hypothetical protein